MGVGVTTGDVEFITTVGVGETEAGARRGVVSSASSLLHDELIRTCNGDGYEQGHDENDGLHRGGEERDHERFNFRLSRWKSRVDASETERRVALKLF